MLTIVRNRCGITSCRKLLNTDERGHSPRILRPGRKTTGLDAAGRSDVPLDEGEATRRMAQEYSAKPEPMLPSTPRWRQRIDPHTIRCRCVPCLKSLRLRHLCGCIIGDVALRKGGIRTTGSIEIGRLRLGRPASRSAQDRPDSMEAMKPFAEGFTSRDGRWTTQRDWRNGDGPESRRCHSRWSMAAPSMSTNT
jgi:hypothetical protein